MWRCLGGAAAARTLLSVASALRVNSCGPAVGPRYPACQTGVRHWLFAVDTATEDGSQLLHNPNEWYAVRASSQSGTIAVPVLPVVQVLRWAWPGTWFSVHMHGFDDFPVRFLHHLRYCLTLHVRLHCTYSFTRCCSCSGLH
jgi:hypothetical protein